MANVEPGGPPLGPAESNLAMAIIVTLLCCMPLGIPAIVYASQVADHNARGDYVAAHAASGKAENWAAWSAGVVILGVLVVCVLGVLLG